MRPSSPSTISSRLGAVVLVLGATAPAFAVDEKPITYDDHVAAILRKNCVQCHGEAKQEAGLNFASFAGVMNGGSGGAVVVAGRSSVSRLLQVISAEDPAERMPPDNDPLAAEQIALIKAWIDAGLRENSGSSVAAQRTLGFKPAPVVKGTGDDGPPPLPGKLPRFERPQTRRPFPVVALATSPRAPLAAVASYGAIDLMASKEKSYGAIAFPEGEPLVLKFSLSGRLLMAAGGRPVQNGAAVLFDVATGKRLAAVGDEPDAVMAADLAPDERQVALGGSGKIVKIFSTETGKVVRTLEKHTDWITAVAFSPDGRLLATGDRVGNIFLWDVGTGGVVLPLLEHKGAIRGLSWRSDGAVVASCGEDGGVVWWDAKDGFPVVNKANAHPPARPPGTYGHIANGVLGAAFGPKGELATCGRDGAVRLWSDSGKELARYPIANDPPNGNSETAGLPRGVKVFPTSVGISADGSFVVAGDSAGRLHAWSSPQGAATPSP